MLCAHICSPQVVVSVGRSLSYAPGSITFVTSSASQFPVAGVAGGVAGGGVCLVLLIAAVILVVRRRESVMKSQVDVLMMQMKTLAEENKRGKHVCNCVCMCLIVCVFMYAHMCVYVCASVMFFFFLCDVPSIGKILVHGNEL